MTQSARRSQKARSGSPAFTTRRATMDDVETLVRMRHDMQAELEDWLYGSPSAHAAYPGEIIEAMREYFIKQLSGFHFAGFFAEAEGKVIGTGGLVVYDVPPSTSNPSGVECYIMNMYTLPEWRGRGVARAILDRLIEHGFGEGARRFWLRASDEGRRVYEHYGFTPRENYMQMFVREEPGARSQ